MRAEKEKEKEKTRKQERERDCAQYVYLLPPRRSQYTKITPLEHDTCRCNIVLKHIYIYLFI